jgi:pimeloyl-ACP methyl ester carboxylesterase
MSGARNARQRPTLVFLPAMLCDEELYRPQIEGLRDLVESMVLTVAEATMAEAAPVVLQQAPPRFLLVGTSYGGSLALEVIIREPSRVAGLWLMGCSPGPHSDPTAARLRNARVQRGEFDTVVEELTATITYEGGPHAVEAASNFRRMAERAGPGIFLRQNTALLDRLDRRADLASVACPTLVVWGREDRFAAVRHGAEIGALIPAARVVVLEECGHLPTLERPDATVALAREWLDQLGVKAGELNAGRVDQPQC